MMSHIGILFSGNTDKFRLALTWLFYYWHRLSCLSPSLQASQMMMPTKFELFVLVSSLLSFDKVSIVFLCVYLSSWVCGYSTAIPYSRTGENSTVGGCFTGQIIFTHCYWMSVGKMHFLSAEWFLEWSIVVDAKLNWSCEQDHTVAPKEAYLTFFSHHNTFLLAMEMCEVRLEGNWWGY
jgi:hypothetical protein